MFEYSHSVAMLPTSLSVMYCGDIKHEYFTVIPFYTVRSSLYPIVVEHNCTSADNYYNHLKYPYTGTNTGLIHDHRYKR